MVPALAGPRPTVIESRVANYDQAGTIPFMSHALQRPAILPLLFLCLAAQFGYGHVSANGGAQLLTSREAGPYRIDVSTLPGQPVVNNTHLSIQVWSLEEEAPITEGTVNVFATGPAGSAPLGPMLARNDVSPRYYETDLPFGVEGEWQVRIVVVAPPGEESVVVPVFVQRGGRFNLFFVTAVGLAVAALSIWTVNRIRRNRATGAR